MLLEHRAMTDALTCILTRRNPVDLHDFRVGLRRFRAALKLYQSIRSDYVATRLDVSLAEFGRSLGPARDAQTWDAFLHRSNIRPAVQRACLVRVRRRADRVTATLRKTMTGNEWRKLSITMERFLSRRMTRSALPEDDVPFAAPAARKLRRLCVRLAGLDIKASSMTSRQLHALRRKVRRGRYWAEFLAPAAPKSVVPKLARLLKRGADALGDAHDIDVYVANIARDRICCAARLKKELRVKRKKAVTKFQKIWNRLHQRRFHSEIMAQLSMLKEKTL
jgi:CHAD domain-containing protein